MKKAILALIFLLLWGAELPAQIHVLRVTNPQASNGVLMLEGVSGTSTGATSVGVELTVPPGGPGVHSWSFGLSHDPNVLQLLSATLTGTAADIPGFSSVNVVAGGVVTSAVLDEDHTNLLPPGSTSLLLLASYEGVFPPKDTTVQTRLRLVDGLSGPEGPVTVQATTWDGQAEATVSPEREPLVLLLSGFTYSQLFDLSLEIPGMVPGGDDNVLPGYIPPSTRPTYTVRVVVDSKLPATATAGAQGWSLSIAHDASLFQVTSLTTQGTDAGLLIRGGFESHETVDNSSGQGIVSAVVLSFTTPLTLPPRGRASLLRLGYQLVADTSVDGAKIGSRIFFKDKLQAQGPPVDNLVTLLGQSNRPLVRRGLILDLTVGDPPRQPFLRADANNDGRVNIADAVWILAEFYLGGPSNPCSYAADVNGDSRRDLSDVAYLIRYEFLGGAPPPEPFPYCGTLPVQVSDRCPVRSTRCSQ